MEDVLQVISFSCMEVELQMQLALSHIHLSTPMMSSGGGSEKGCSGRYS